MPDIQQTQDILSQCKKKLATFKEQAKEISRNKDVQAWQKVNIDSFLDVIEGLGLPGNLRQSRDSYPEIAQTVLKEITTIQNNIENLDADIKLGPLPASEAIIQAKKIKQQIAQLFPAMEKLLYCKNNLESSSKALKENLSLKTLLPLARDMATGKKKSVFETGFKIYLITTRETDFAEEEDQVNMYSYFDQAALLQKKIEALSTDGISSMAASMVNQQLRLCTEGLQEVKDFILFIEHYVEKDMENINIFHAKLAEVTRQPLTDILFNIPAETENVGACIRDFTHKKFLLEEIDRAVQLLLMIDQFYQIVKDHFLDYLRKQNSLENGLLNPLTLSQVRANNYFSGITGTWRMIRLLIGSVNTEETLSEEILQRKLQDLLENCTDFFGYEENDPKNISTFIESYFKQYNTPFPHDELIEIAKKCLITYGTILEKVMFKFKAETDNNKTKNYSLGRLSGKIEVRTTNLKKYRKKLTPA
jgi:hypothetical protein